VCLVLNSVGLNAVYWHELLSTVRAGTSYGLKQIVTEDAAVEGMIYSAL